MQLSEIKNIPSLLHIAQESSPEGNISYILNIAESIAGLNGNGVWDPVETSQLLQTVIINMQYHKSFSGDTKKYADALEIVQDEISKIYNAYSDETIAYGDVSDLYKALREINQTLNNEIIPGIAASTSSREEGVANRKKEFLDSQIRHLNAYDQQALQPVPGTPNVYEYLNWIIRIVDNEKGSFAFSISNVFGEDRRTLRSLDRVVEYIKRKEL